MKLRHYFSAAFLFAIATYAPAWAESSPLLKELRILRVTPEGEDVESTRQIVIEFNRPVVPLGRMERDASELPIRIEPAVECQWRWLDTTTLSCNLNEKTQLVPATQYMLTIEPGIRAEDGATIAETASYSFITKRPDVRYSWFDSWRSPGTPVIRVIFNQPVFKRSVARHLYIDSGQGRDSLLVYPLPNDSEAPIIKGREEARYSWLVRPRRELPLDAHAMLMVEPGLVSAVGPEPGVEERELVGFDTFPAFRFAGITCTSSTRDESITFAPGDAQREKCNPMESIALTFTTPVLREVAKRYVTLTPSLTAKRDGDPWGENSEEDDSDSGPRAPHEKGRLYKVYFPVGLKAATTYHVASEPSRPGFFMRQWRAFLGVFGIHPASRIEDAFGRRIDAAFAMDFATDHRAPNYEMPNQEAVLEKGVDSELPLYVNNIDTATFSYNRILAAGAAKELSHTLTPPKVKDVQFAIPGGVRDMLDGKSGALYGTLSTEPGVEKSDYARTLFAQVTPYNVHLKMGHFTSLAWVTDFATGQPVAGAKVTVQRGTFDNLGAQMPLANGVTDASGIARFAGVEAIDPKEEFIEGWGEGEKLFLRVDRGEDVALLPLTYDFAVDIWRASNEEIYPSNLPRNGHLRAWGTTAQGVYRVGQTIEYKLFVRNESNTTLVAPPKGEYTLELVDPTGKKVDSHENIAFSAFGAYSGSYTIPEHAVMGWYRFQLKARFREGDGKNYHGEVNPRVVELEPIRVLVSDFTPASFKVRNELNGDLFTAGQTLEVTTLASLYSGGAYTDASTRVTAMVEPTPFKTKAPSLQGFRFDSGEDEYGREMGQASDALDDKGERVDRFTLEDAGVVYGRLIVESAVEDDRGKYIAAEARADYHGRDRYVGLKSDRWVYEAGKKAELLYAVADAKGEPVSDAKVDIAFEREETTSARVKGAGNAYLTEFKSEWKKIAGCSKGDAPGHCSFTPNKAGYYRAIARVTDSKGRVHETKSHLYVTGSDYVLWDDGESNALPLIPEKPEYKVGDTARYLVRNPYPGAQALVTIERYGVIDSFTTVLEGSAPTISFEVKPDYLPGFYLSVIAFSPRAEKPFGKVGELDLGKPAYRIGYVQVPVKDPYKEIKVEPKVAAEEYRPRDTVEVAVHAEPRMQGKGEPIELTAIVLDEAVFDLIAEGRSYFDPYAGLFTLDGLDLRNYSLLTRLIGRQVFEKKGANPGGDGGADLSMRNRFKFVAYWNPSLRTDAAGNAHFSFEAPDNLTGWRVLTLAATPSDRFGLGEASFKVNRPTEIRPVMPNQVMEGDSFTAGFSVMNRTDKERTLKVEIEAQGNVDAKQQTATVSQTITLAPYKRTTVELPLTASRVEEDRDAPPGAIYFTAHAGDETDRDGIEHRMPVLKQRTLVTAASYGSTTEDEVRESIAIPQAIKTDIGDIRVVVSPSVIANLEGSIRYLRDYPFICWEQKLTRALAASQYLQLKDYVSPDMKWKDVETLPQSVLDAAAGHQAPGGGMGYFKPSDDYADPYLSAYTALAFNWLSAAGYQVPSEVEAKLHGYLLDLLRHDTAPDFYDRGMLSDVRATALAALAQHQKVTKDDLLRFAPHMKRMSLMGKAQFLAAANALGETDIARQTLDAILASGVESGGKFSFNESIDDGYKRILATPLRDNCAVLSSLLSYGDTELTGDKPMKLARSIMQSRGKRDCWQNTQENIFCLNAMVEYARAFESETPDMKVSASFDREPMGEGSFRSFRDAAQTFRRAIDKGDAGRKAQVTITREGDGRLYYATQLSYAPSEGKDAVQNAGIDIRREYSVERNKAWGLLKDPSEIQRGELVKVDLYASLPTARNFVVISDPVPGGLEPVNRELATESKLDANKAEMTMAKGAYWFTFGEWFNFGESRWSFYHQEIRHDAVRFYSDYLPAGNYHLSYTAQAIAPGRFTILPAKAEEMYDPDVFGTSARGALAVGAKE